MILDKRNNLLILILLLFSFLSKGQVSGYIYDSETKKALPFCNIVCDATNSGTTTNLNGKFEIDAKIGSKLYISFIGYTTKKIVVNKKNLKKIYLTSKSALISEIKVVMKEDPAVILMREVIKKLK